MKSPNRSVVVAFCILAAWAAQAEVQVNSERRQEDATPDFKFQTIPRPARNDAATKADFSLVDGRRDPNGGELAVLHDGQMPSEEDAPGENFFFSAGTDGGRILVDLGRAIEVKQVNTYSWHANSRAPQVYKLYASIGQAVEFNPRPKRDTDPGSVGWKLVATVDTRPASGEPGGQYGVRVGGTNASLGLFRYLLFAVSSTENRDPFGNTFFSEIDVLERNGPAVEFVSSASSEARRETVETDGGQYRFTLDTTDAPDLTEWTRQTLTPVVREWYPKLVALLPGEGFVAPKSVSIVFSKKYQGVAATSGTRIECSAQWFRQNLQGEALGSVVHELIHVVQHYGRTSPSEGSTPPPGWLVEGIADYLGWYQFEPQSHGADISPRGFARASYDGSYRITANFLNWVTEHHGADFVPKLNAIIRAGRYNEVSWKELTGQTVQELGRDWKAALAKQLNLPLVAPDPTLNTLTPAEKAVGWQLLFNGRDFTGWHNFKSDAVRPGWQVQDGALVCADPHDAGDLVTAEQFGWFELQLDYNISEGGNSGIIFHVADEGGAVWASGPEFQLEDNAKAADPVRCGWLYGLYQPPNDPQTARPLDATKPAGEWNHVRLLIGPDQCLHEINGVKYFDYVLGSDDFQARVARSKFATMPLFAKSHRGRLALQGDHGQVSFRNLKIRPLAPAQ